MTLALNVEPRFSGPIIQSAAALMGHAITAKQAKIDKKLKMVELQLKKAALDQKVQLAQAKLSNPVTDAEDGHGVIINRNDLLRQILGKAKEA